MPASWKKAMTNLDNILKQQRHHFANKGPSSQVCGFPSSHVWTWELDHKEVWVLKNCCFWTLVLEKTLESDLDCKEIKPVNPKGNQLWIFIGNWSFIDAEAKTPTLWPSYVKIWLTGKKPWCRERLGARGEEDDRGWDGCMASPTQWTWVWADSGR